MEIVHFLPEDIQHTSTDIQNIISINRNHDWDEDDDFDFHFDANDHIYA